MTPELAELLKDIVAMMYREAGGAWCTEMIDRINKIANPSTPQP